MSAHKSFKRKTKITNFDILSEKNRVTSDKIFFENIDLILDFQKKIFSCELGRNVGNVNTGLWVDQ